MSAKEFFDRYGISLAVLGVLALIVVVLPGNADNRSVEAGLGSSDFSADPNADPFAAGDVGVDTTGDDPSLSPDSTVASGTGGTGGTGGGSGGGGAGGSSGGGGGGTATNPNQPTGTAAVQFGTGPNCRDDGREKGISAYMPPCVAWNGSDNGGTTFRGVTKDTITIVRYLPQLDAGTRAILQGADLSDSPEAVKDAYTKLFRYSNLHYETYGREVKFVDVAASGASENEEAMRADALKIVNDIKPFAVIEGDPAAAMPTVLIRELALRNMICLCGTSGNSPFYTELPPVIFSSLPTADEYAAHIAEYVGKKLKGKNAEFAGDRFNPTQGYNGTPRKYGLIYLNGARGKVEPEGERARKAFVREFAKYGIEFTEQVGYLYDPGRNAQDVTSIIAKMRGSGVTTIVPVWDPLYPILITTEASNQQYFPEWLIVGTGLSDTTTAGRLYDQKQWSNAFGISPLWVTWETVAASPGAREYTHGRKGGEGGDGGILINIYRARIETLFRGIHLAGPNLTTDSYVRAQFNYPPTGGSPGIPLFFMTRQFPTEYKDFTEVWYDEVGQGPDERGRQGPGRVLKANGGQRFQLGEWTTDPSRAFDPAGTVHVSDNPEGGTHPPHEQDGHVHPDDQRCLSCG